nr:MAG TPA: hypothetical protein [Microviridae sp.]
MTCYHPITAYWSRTLKIEVPRGTEGVIKWRLFFYDLLSPNNCVLE